MFLDGAELDGDDPEEQYTSDFVAEDKPMLGVQGEGLGPQTAQTRPKKSGAAKKPINLVTQ
jgi:hypothetical protein